ncbi:MAG: response regulator [Pirellulaceae bacterium]|jgi:CheY-like chemotaxis protein/HD-like signal output (HDOD) protein|nr:response regulator [Pirellulaceae bacterium]
MIEILFVDDDELILAGQRRMLRANRDEWNITTRPGGAEGLDYLAENPVDIVISDMRMPQMDGATFLGRVRERRPGVIRVILSGQSDDDSTVRAASAAHQFLSKPCNAEQLKTAIRRGVTARQRIPHEALRDFVCGLASCPSDQELLRNIKDCLEADSLTVEQYGELAARDPALVLKVAQLVSTSFFGAPQHHIHPSQALQLFGVDLMRQLILEENGMVRPAGVAGPTAEFTSVAHDCAQTATRLAVEYGVCHPEDAGVAATIAQLGDCLLAEFAGGMDKSPAADGDSRSPFSTDLATYGLDRFELAAALAEIWGVPSHIATTARFIRLPSQCKSPPPTLLPAHMATVLHRHDVPADYDFLDARQETERFRQLRAANLATAQ